MTAPPPSKKQSEHDPPPGAERFWGQFSQAGTKKGAGSEKEHPASEQPGHGHECLEWCPICRSAELLRQAVTPELAEQVLNLQKEAAAVLRSFVQAYGEKGPDADGSDATPDEGSGHDRSSNGHRSDAEPGPRVTDIRID